MKYTLTGSPAFEERLDHDFQKIVEEVRKTPEGAYVQAVVLVGGYARGEGTPLPKGGYQVPFNDYDILLVGSPMSRQGKWHYQKQWDFIALQLSNLLGIEVDLAFEPINRLKTSEQSLMNYEIKYGHQILWGPPEILSSMPQNEISKIPLSEGARLMMNRGDLLFDVQKMLHSALNEEIVLKIWTYLLKNYLAFGDSLLLMKNQYDLSYVQKRERIRSFAADNKIPFADKIVAGYQLAIDFKLYGDMNYLSHLNIQDVFEEVKNLFPRYFLWYEGERLKSSFESLQDYCHAIERSPPENRLKSMALNFALFKDNALKPNYHWFLRHPRLRLYPSLIYLLQNHKWNTQEALLAKLIGCDGSNKEKLEHFRTLRKRLA